MEPDLVIVTVIFTILIAVSLAFCIWSLVLIYENQSSIQNINNSIDIIQNNIIYNALDIPLINGSNASQVATISLTFERKQGKTQFYLNAVEDFTLVGTAEWFDFIVPELPTEFLLDNQLTFSFPSKNDAFFCPSGILIPSKTDPERKFTIFPLASFGTTAGENTTTNTFFEGTCGWNQSPFSY